jgi:hypothetical protein
MTEIRLRADGVFWREFAGEVVALDTAASRYLSANPSAAVLWKRLSDGATEADLVDALCERFKVSRPAAQADVTAFVEHLDSRGLLEASAPH